MSPKKEIYDVIIVGAGPAGLTAAIYTSRRTLKTLVLSKDIGGQINLTTKIENYPGIELIDGVTMASKFSKQAEKFGAKILQQEVTAVTTQDDLFLVSTKKDKYLSKSLVLAFGLMPRTLDVPGEKQYTGKGVSYCATCDAPLYYGKIVAVVGGGNSGLDAALLLSKIAKQIYIIHRHDGFKGEEVTQEKLKHAKNVNIKLAYSVSEIKGNDFVHTVVIKSNDGKKEEEIKIDGVFIEIGYRAQTSWLEKLVSLNGNGEIVVNKDLGTTHEGIFACGDVADTPDKQIVIAAGQGAQAGLGVYKYIAEIEGIENPDWDK